MIVTRAFDSATSGTPIEFTDVGPVVKVATDELSAAGVLTACDDTGPLFCPDEDLTRGEAMRWLVGLMGIGDPTDLPGIADIGLWITPPS